MRSVSLLVFLLIALVASCHAIPKPGSVGQGPGGPDTRPSPLGTCPEEDGFDSVYLPDKYYCGIFHQCSNGTPYRMNCPEGLHWNRYLYTCDYPKKARCNS